MLLRNNDIIQNGAGVCSCPLLLYKWYFLIIPQTCVQVYAILIQAIQLKIVSLSSLSAQVTFYIQESV